MTYKCVSYYVPRYKYEIINWLKSNVKYSKTAMQSMNMDRLLAIYHSIRQRGL